MRVERRGPAGIWGRRVIVVPAAWIAAVVAVAALPVIVIVTLVSDAFRRRRFATTRIALLLVGGTLIEAGGTLVALLLWIVSGFGLARGWLHHRSQELQVAWGTLLFRWVVAVLRLDVSVEGIEVLTPGPVLLFMRHTSVADTLAPAALFARPTGLRLRYVMKRELLWVPGINVMAPRTPNCFVRRGAGGESRFVGMLADDLGPRDGVLIYPEGMVLTPAKAAARAGDPGKPGVREQPYQRVHPPRLGGPLALLERAAGRGADVVFVAHVGFEAAPGVRQLLRGDLIGARVRFACWRVPGGEVPMARPAMADWLHERWHEVDAWVAHEQDRLDIRPATR